VAQAGRRQPQGGHARPIHELAKRGIKRRLLLELLLVLLEISIRQAPRGVTDDQTACHVNVIRYRHGRVPFHAMVSSREADGVQCTRGATWMLRMPCLSISACCHQQRGEETATTSEQMTLKMWSKSTEGNHP
jgi:hypothetical protein